jgi:hypothetical protein
VARKRLRNKRRDNGRYQAVTDAQQWKNCWKQCFLCGPLRGYITRPTEFSSVHSVIAQLAADTYLFKLQRLQNKVLRTIGNFPRCTPVRDIHTTFNLPYVYDYVTKLCRKQAEVIRNHENEHVRGIGKGEARHRKYKRLKLGGGQA